MKQDEPSETLVPTPWRRVRPLWRTVALTVATINLYWFYWFWATWRELKHETGDRGMKPIGHMLSLFVPIYQLFRIYAHFRKIRDLVVERSEGQGVAFPSLSPGAALVFALVGSFLIRLSADLSFRPPAYTASPWQESLLLLGGTLLGFHASLGGPLQGSFWVGWGYHLQTEDFYLYVAFPVQLSLSPGVSVLVFFVGIGVLAVLILSAQQALNRLWLQTPGTIISGTSWYHWAVLLLGAGGWAFVLWGMVS
jgi:hypothetical protein